MSKKTRSSTRPRGSGGQAISTFEQLDDAEAHSFTRIHLVTWLTCATIAVILGSLTLGGSGPTPDIGLTFDSGNTYSVHEAKLTWLVIIAAGVSALGYAVRCHFHTSDLVIYYTMPVVMSLIAVDILALSRVHDGHMLVLGAVAGFLVSFIENTGAYMSRKLGLYLATGMQVTGAEGWDDMLELAWFKSRKIGIYIAVGMQVAAIGGWAAILEVAWYTAAWSEHHLGSITPNYVIPVLAATTVVLALTKIVHLVALHGTCAATATPWRSEAALCALHVALLAVVGFVPML